MANVMSGMGYERDQWFATAGRGRRQENPRAWHMSIDLERKILPLDRENFDHANFVRGDLVSISKQGKLVPLNSELPFTGIVDSVGEDRGTYIAAVVTRGGVVLRVQGLGHETPQGAPVHALPGPTQTFNLQGQGVCIGEILAIESLERSAAIVGIKLSSDERPLELGGNRPSRFGRN